MPCWETLSTDVVEVIVLWIGDALVVGLSRFVYHFHTHLEATYQIYRYFLAWKQSYWVVLLPLALFLLSLGE